MHSPFWQVAWSTLQGPAGLGSTAGFLTGVVVVGGVVKTGGGLCLDSTTMIGQSQHAGCCTSTWRTSHAAASVLPPEAGAKLTTVGLITHVSAVRPVVTQVFHQDARSIATPVLIRHASSDHRRYWERGAMADQRHAGRPISATETQPHQQGGSRGSQTDRSSPPLEEPNVQLGFPSQM